MSKVKFRPLGEKILVKPVESDDKTAGGIILPDTAKEKPQRGEVIVVGPGKINDKGERIPQEVKDGDIVIYTKYGGSEFKFDGIEYKILSPAEILAVIE